MAVLEQVIAKTELKVAKTSVARFAGLVMGTGLIALLAVAFLYFVYVVGQGLADAERLNARSGQSASDLDADQGDLPGSAV